MRAKAIYPYKALASLEKSIMTERKEDFEKFFLEDEAKGWTTCELIGIAFSSKEVYAQYVCKSSLADERYGIRAIKTIEFKRWMWGR